MHISITLLDRSVYEGRQTLDNYWYLFIYLFIQHFYSALFINKYALMRYA